MTICVCHNLSAARYKFLNEYDYAKDDSRPVYNLDHKKTAFCPQCDRDNTMATYALVDILLWLGVILNR